MAGEIGAGRQLLASAFRYGAKLNFKKKVRGVFPHTLAPQPEAPGHDVTSRSLWREKVRRVQENNRLLQQATDIL